MVEKILVAVDEVATNGVCVETAVEYDRAREFHLTISIGNSSYIEVFESDTLADDDERLAALDATKQYFVYRNEQFVMAGNDLFDTVVLAGIKQLVANCIDMER